MANLYEAINVLLTTVLLLYGTRPLVAISVTLTHNALEVVHTTAAAAYRARVFTQSFDSIG